jgi:UDP-N-acetylbacillosamine N-acetyltransferase
MKLAIWGIGGHAKVVADMVRAEGQYVIAAFIDDADPSPTDTFRGVPIVTRPEFPERLQRLEVGAMVIAVGDNRARMRLGAVARAQGFRLATVIHPRAVVSSDSVIGAGTVIMAGAIVNPDAVVGEHAIINTGATVDHDCNLGDGVHISPGAHLAGSVRVGQGTWIGIGACVSNGIRIGSNSVIGAGSVVIDDVPDDVVAYGIPALVVRSHE